MKNKKKVIIPVVILAVIIAAVAIGLNVLSSNGVLNMADVYSTVRKVLPYFIPFFAIVVIGIVLSVVLRKKAEKIRFMVGRQSLIAGFLALVVTVNVVCAGPMQTVLNLAFATGTGVTEETAATSKETSIQIAEEGTVLLKNENGILPLSTEVKKLNVFGWASTNPCYGGTGSGAVDTSTCTDVLSSLTDAGYELNTDLSDFYKNYRADRPEVGMWSQDWTLPEPKTSDYSDDLLSGAKDFSDYAMIVITRVGGEGADLPTDMSQVTYEGNEGDFQKGQTYLELSKSEKEMVEMVTSSFDHVIVLINAANSMELGWLNEYPSIEGALWMAGAGQDGFTALGEVLDGTVNPSGKLPDTYVYDLQNTPTYQNIGNFTYDNMDDLAYTSKDYFSGQDVTTTPSFVNYVEGIYVGYRFYETFYLDNEDGYSKTVQYPFGYGLSYTTFSQKMSELTTNEKGDISFDVTVTNTGDTAGKDVVEVYYTAPYYEGGIEKSAVDLVEFGKTDLLEPGKSQTVTITLNQEDMASYDASGEGSYVLEQGDYNISIRSDSHSVLDSKTYQVASEIVYNEENKRSTDKTAATNEFTDYSQGDVTYLSRADHFANYKEATAAPKNYSMSEEAKAGFTNDINYQITKDDSDTMPATGVKNGMKLYDLAGADYDDSKWDTLLDQMTVTDMANVVALGGYQTVAADSVGKVATVDADGPAAYSSFFNDAIKGTAFPCAAMIAATWNKELAYDRGVNMGQEGTEIGVSGWYGPAMNIHRNAFAGRNFEYYSEDGVLSGKMAAKEVSGAASKGVYAYIKHFVLNDQETNRCGMICTWSTEQAIRQIYLKPFEEAVKEGGATAVMSSFNYIGNQWAGSCDQLLNQVLREEWGFRGLVCTDYFGGYGYMDGDKAIRNGGDIMLSTTGEAGATLEDKKSATAVSDMRTACHNILYTVVNSNAYDNYSEGLNLQPWMKVMVGVDVLLAALMVILEVFTVKKYRKFGTGSIEAEGK